MGIAHIPVVGNALTKDMRLTFCILTILTLSASTLYGQEVKKCDGTVLSTIAEKIGIAEQKEITDFLLTFGQECRNNIEYSEWSNELLFSLLDKQTELIIKTIEKQEKRIEIDIILDDLSEPIHDIMNIKSIIVRVEKVNINKTLKDKILERLTTVDGRPN